MFTRLLIPPTRQSFFLFGPRGSGKSTILKKHFPESKYLWFNLLDPYVEDELTINPSRFRDAVLQSPLAKNGVVVDEIQKAPKLLNYVHMLIESHKIRFILTGSSARRLKQKGSNLLAGRAVTRSLHPLTHKELGDSFDLNTSLEWGNLPSLYHFQDDIEKKDYLQSYALSYVRGEVQAEQWVRKIEAFKKFLPVASQMNGEPLNFSKISKESGVEIPTVKAYYQILEDTYMGFELPSYHRSVRKQQREASKFYFFDLGVARAFQKTLDIPVRESTSNYGKLFEQWLILEIRKLLDYSGKDYEFSYLQSKDGAEIDLILKRPKEKAILIEIKSATRTDTSDAKHLYAFKKDFPGSRCFVLSRDDRSRVNEGVEFLHWKKGLKELGLDL